MESLPSIVGIDYSMSCPAVCIHSGDTWSFDNCKFFFLTDRKKFQTSDKTFISISHVDYSSDEERFNNISSSILGVLPESKSCSVYIEGYAFGAKGRVFHIGENTGLLKHKLWSAGYEYCVMSPSQVKKIATGKGNANKLKMHDAFVGQTGFKLDVLFGCIAGQSPIADLIDAYFISKFGFNIQKQSQVWKNRRKNVTGKE